MNVDYEFRLSISSQQSLPTMLETNLVDSEQRNANRYSAHEKEGEFPDNLVDEDEKVIFEPLFPDPFELSYTCLLIPRFGSHHLIGDLADNLHVWMKRISISFGWKLDFVIVKPDFLEWAMQVTPITSPAYCIQVVRQQLTTQIFEEHPRFKRENLSSDFWARGHVIVIGSRPLPDEIIKGFIQSTRRQQES